ncbi:RNASET2 [Mytilus edulis]|uniref:RNASET2 n=1 Tax=Mytilus edulis TaxID=6550 RepID=A0A8S3SE13_MYTED|nr:RNASET2 [Mytilus edulis]
MVQPTVTHYESGSVSNMSMEEKLRRLQSTVTELQAKMNSLNDYVGFTATSIRGWIPPGSIIPFRHIKTSYGVTSASQIESIGHFKAEQHGLYVVGVTVFTHEGGYYQICKNDAMISEVIIKHSEGSGTSFIVIELAVGSIISNLTDELQHAWLNIFRKSRPSDFWKHEWNTHGTCALSLNTTGTEYLFFRKALDLIKTYNASKFLNKVNITPSDTTPYVTKTIENILKKKLGVMPNLQCYRYKSQSGKRKTDLAEIRICMDKQFKLIKCPHGDSTLYWSRLSQTQSCRGGEIYIPEIKRN